MPSPVAREPKLWVEFDCRIRSNNLGLLQNDDVLPGKPTTIVFGDSFTSGQGGCPWFHKLQARRPQEQLSMQACWGPASVGGGACSSI